MTWAEHLSNNEKKLSNQLISRHGILNTVRRTYRNLGSQADSARENLA